MDSPKYCEINSDMTLQYINRILMEEDIDEKASIYQDRDVLQATEKPFYDILGQAYPSSAKEIVLNSDNQVVCPDDSSNNYHEGACSGSFINVFLGSQSMYLTSNDCTSETEDLSLQLTEGAEEANFVPTIEKLAVEMDSSELIVSKKMTPATVGERGKVLNKIRSHPRVNLELLGVRNSKHLAISSSETIRDGTFDNVLLCTGKLYCDAAHLKEMKAKEACDNSQNAQSKEYGQRRVKSRSKKQQEEAIDLRALLIQCAEAIASNNQPFDGELLTKIRNHSSPHGDGSQRLAIYFVDALEARVAGTGSQMYPKLMAKRTSTTNMLKAYRLFTAACPFTKVAYYYSNQTIVDVSVGRPRVHIIDFGIVFGFQWPSLIQRLANQEGGPPNLRITGIDVPEPGFRPCKKIEETGKRLAEYAEMFNVPFQYQAVASRWENICINDLNIDKNEVLIVNCLHQMNSLSDETEDIDSARDRVLRIMKRMNPEVLIIGVTNGLYNSPFFLPRFREALFYYSSQFDMLNSTVARSHEARILIERDLLGTDVFNVVACEGAERIDKPESYKQWQVRILKAGFKQLPVNQTILKSSLERKKELYHEDFVMDEDSGWLVQGWKGRILHALSSWKPKESCTNQ